VTDSKNSSISLTGNGMPSSGVDVETGEMRDIVRPSLASRPMSPSLAVYRWRPTGYETMLFSLDSPGRNLLGRAIDTVFRVSWITIRIVDGGPVHR